MPHSKKECPYGNPDCPKCTPASAEKPIVNQPSRDCQPIVNQDWERKFDEISDSASAWCSCMEGDMYDAFPDQQNKAKSFIHSLLKSDRQRIRERVDKLQPPKYGVSTIDEVYYDGYNTALEDVLKELE